VIGGFEMNERQQEINFTINMIQKLCEECNICLVAKERKGVKYVGIHDNVEDMDYCLIKNKEV
jgi:hypothetical protein